MHLAEEVWRFKYNERICTLTGTPNTPNNAFSNACMYSQPHPRFYYTHTHVSDTHILVTHTHTRYTYTHTLLSHTHTHTHSCHIVAHTHTHTLVTHTWTYLSNAFFFFSIVFLGKKTKTKNQGRTSVQHHKMKHSTGSPHKFSFVPNKIKIKKTDGAWILSHWYSHPA